MIAEIRCSCKTNPFPTAAAMIIGNIHDEFTIVAARERLCAHANGKTTRVSSQTLQGRESPQANKQPPRWRRSPAATRPRGATPPPLPTTAPPPNQPVAWSPSPYRSMPPRRPFRRRHPIPPPPAAATPAPPPRARQVEAAKYPRLTNGLCIPQNWGSAMNQIPTAHSALVGGSGVQRGAVTPRCARFGGKENWMVPSSRRPQAKPSGVAGGGVERDGGEDADVGGWGGGGDGERAGEVAKMEEAAEIPKRWSAQMAR
ncbi:Protein of unknown function [Gryllus bimaculatus]|nr:Protein of unknown function [Gryllus bimaculatus]